MYECEEGDGDRELRAGRQFSVLLERVRVLRRVSEERETNPSSPVIADLLERSLGGTVRALRDTPLEGPADV